MKFKLKISSAIFLFCITRCLSCEYLIIGSDEALFAYMCVRVRMGVCAAGSAFLQIMRLYIYIYIYMYIVHLATGPVTYSDCGLLRL